MGYENKGVIVDQNDPMAVFEARMGFIKQECNDGANDFEISRLNELIEEVKAGKIEIEQALEEAQKILDSKQSYH